MIEFNPLLNTCYLTTDASRSIAYYSHLIPIFFSLGLGLLVSFKAPKNILSKIFLAFSVVFSFWLVADLITWVSNNYFLVYALWAPIDYIETVMFILGLYFILVFVNKINIQFYKKIFLFLASLIPFIITITQKSVLGFNYSVCEGLNNSFLLNYRFLIEILVVIIILLYLIIPLIRKKIVGSIKSYLLILGSMFLFLTIFGVTSYLSAVTAYYELHLYALFIIPIFLIAITYGIFSLDVFNIRIVSTYFIVFGFIVLALSQLIFITSTTNKLLTIISVIFSIILSVILFKNLKKESDQRIRIEKLSKDLELSKMRVEETNINLEIANDKLKSLDKLKTEFLSLASHQLRSPLTAIKGYTSMLEEGDYGEINPQVKEIVNRIYLSSQSLTKVVEDLLDVTKIEQGGMKYEMAEFDLSLLAREVTKDLSISAEKKGLKLSFNLNNKDEGYMVNGDKEKIRQVVLNLIDNSIKYTKVGEINVLIKKENDKILLTINDTGMGMTDEMKSNLFVKFSRGEGVKADSTGSGLGLYLAKQIITAHKGRIWGESEGPNKGSTFFIELEAVK